jgi:parallel beta-helix repeat protein
MSLGAKEMTGIESRQMVTLPRTIAGPLLLLAVLLSVPMSLAAPDLPVASTSDDRGEISSFGAKGDGVTDDTAAIQSAIDATGIAIVPPGVYRITRPIRMSNGQKLTGNGTMSIDFNTLKPQESTAAVLVDGDDVLIRGIHIIKKFVDGSYDSGIIVVKGHKNITIREVEVSGYSARYGIHIIEADGFEVTGCFIHDFMMNEAADMIADSPAGIRITRCKRGVVSNNRVMNIEVGPRGRASISPLRPKYGPQGYQSDHVTLAQCSEISVTGNVLQTSGEGIDLLLSRHCTVTGNIIADIWFQGVKMLGVSGSTVTGNSIRDCYQGIGLANHDSFRRPCFANIISGNTILNTGSSGSFDVPASTRVRYSGTYGIDVHEGCDQNVISSNVILDTQKSRTMRSAIHRGSGKRNIFSGNVTVDEEQP